MGVAVHADRRTRASKRRMTLFITTSGQGALLVGKIVVFCCSRVPLEMLDISGINFFLKNASGSGSSP
jgi:hypothetical protein